MKNIHILFGIILLLLTSTGSSNQISDYKDNKCNFKRLSTMEPGTCLSWDAYRLLKIIKKVTAKQKKVDYHKKFFNNIEPRVYCVKDTLVRTGSVSVLLRIYYPTKESTMEPHPIVFYVHGGAFIFGSIEQSDMLAKKISLATRSIVTSVDYRLAPEFPFPAAIDDSYCALDWVADNAESLGGTKGGVCLLGTSAGGNIATVLTLKSRALGHPHIACQILYYPPTTFQDIEFPSRFYFLQDSSRSYLLTEEIVRRSKESYMGSYTNDMDPYLSPLLAELDTGLPPRFNIHSTM